MVGVVDIEMNPATKEWSCVVYNWITGPAEANPTPTPDLRPRVWKDPFYIQFFAFRAYGANLAPNSRFTIYTVGTDGTRHDLLTQAADANGNFTAVVHGTEQTLGDAFADVQTKDGPQSLPLR